MPSAEFITLDPELEAILREVAADPDSPLLRVTRPQRIRGLFERGGKVSERSALLGKAERHLVQVYRDEVAWLLRQAALVKLLEGPRGRLYASRYCRGGGEYPLLKPREFRDRAQETAAARSVLDDGSSLLELINLCADDPLGEEPTAADLAAASLRLQPTDEARVLAGIDFAHRDSPWTALRVMGDVLASDPLPGVAASVWSCIGFVYSRWHEYGRSRRAYAKHCSLDPEGIPAWMFRLCMSLQTGDTSEALQSAQSINDLAPRGRLHVDRFVRSLAKRRRSGEWTPTTDALRLVPIIRDRIGDAAGRIADVFA